MVRQNSGRRIREEKQAVGYMIALYCQRHHQPRHSRSTLTQNGLPQNRCPENKQTLCEHCQDLYDYAMQRLTLCRFGEDKPTCAHCPKHCYRKDYQRHIRQVMRFAGPRMIFYHPLIAIRHLIQHLQSRRTR
ncbi:nitrous oxide-stimulated promoter family protein [Utexia brackfieldae]|uniref:nitrous oxide-stimulated promoter family protein n=1 Tax=Utexia brackfieldae TaxID=3074108 RepID=UPI00370DCDD5